MCVTLQNTATYPEHTVQFHDSAIFLQFSLELPPITSEDLCNIALNFDQTSENEDCFLDQLAYLLRAT